MENKPIDWEQQIDNLMEDIRNWLSPEIWQNILLDCSKNELLVMWLLYRKKECNMSQIAKELRVPLNTATGIIGRMEKRELLRRERSIEDKRVVTICLSSHGEAQMLSVIREMTYYGSRVLEELSSEEIDLLLRMLTKVTSVLREEHQKEKQKSSIRRIEIE